MRGRAFCRRARIVIWPALDTAEDGRLEPMTSPKSDFLRRATARGFVHQVTDAEGLDAAAAGGRL